MTTQLKNGYMATEVQDEVRERVKKFFMGQRSGLVRLQPHGWLLPKAFLKFADKIYDFEFKKDDVIVMTWPKCGNTWMQEIVWTMRNNPNLDNTRGNTSVRKRCPFVDFDMSVPLSYIQKEGGPLHGYLQIFENKCPGRKLEDGLFLQLAEHLEEPRTLKFHLPFSFLNPVLLQVAKTVVVIRNPKDVCVSYHHHCRRGDFHGFCGSLDDFVDFFVNDELYYSPYWPFMREVFEKRDHPKVHLVFFEDLKADPPGELRRLDAFLGTNLTDDQISKIVEHTKFEAMRDRETALTSPASTGQNLEVIEKEEGFFRKGEVGNYKSKLTPGQEAKIDAWTQKNSGGLHTELKYSI